MDYTAEILEWADAFREAKNYQEFCLLIIMSLPAEENLYLKEALHLINRWTNITQSRFIQSSKRKAYLEELEGDMYGLLIRLQIDYKIKRKPIFIDNWYYNWKKYTAATTT